MRCLHYAANGKPDDVIRIMERPDPVAAPGMVIVELEAVPVHIADLKAIAGNLAFIPRGPGIPGFEGVGRIVALGQGVSGWSIGDRVILPMAHGAMQERRAIVPDQLWRAPDHVPAAQLALVRINLSTAYLLLNAYVTLRPGDWIIQNAANSNVGGYVAALACARGIGVINVARRPAARDALLAAGRAEVVVDDRQAIIERCAALGQAPRLAFDAIGGEATARLGNVVADGGLVLAYGFLAEQSYRIDYADAMFRDVRLRAMMTDRATERLGAEGQARMVESLERFIGEHELGAEIAGVYSFDQAADAFRHAALSGEERAGKVIIVP